MKNDYVFKKEHIEELSENGVTYRREEMSKEEKELYMKCRKYGISVKYYKDLLRVQQNACAICGKSEDIIERYVDKIKKHNNILQIDHCHSRNIVRGLLCWNCNVALGHFKDSLDVLKSAVNYMEEFEDSLG